MKLNVLGFITGNTKALVTSLDCNRGVFPQTQGALTCTINGSLVHWYSPPSDNTANNTEVHVYIL